jgi:hypothetical protein
VNFSKIGLKIPFSLNLEASEMLKYLAKRITIMCLLQINVHVLEWGSKICTTVIIAVVFQYIYYSVVIILKLYKKIYYENENKLKTKKNQPLYIIII